MKALAPGIHWFWPATTNLVTYPVVRQGNDLRAQTLTTTDSVTLAASALIVYEVFDIVALLAYTYDADNTIGEIALTAIQDVLTGLSWRDLQGLERRKLDVRLRRAAAKALKPYGVRVLKMSLTDLAPCRVIKLLGATIAGSGTAVLAE